MKFHNRFSRVDLQVSVMTGAMVILSCSLLFALAYGLTSRDMIQGLQDQTNSIYSYLDEELDAESFRSISTREDAALPEYQATHELLDRVKRATGVRYLYTAKPLADNSFVYVVDGLSPDAEDFRYPGDPIEPEIIGDMRTALGSTPVLPDHIKNTSWGPIYISYLPIHEDGEVVGVLGIEFDAQHQYNTYRLLLGGAPVVILLFCIFAGSLSVLLFRRVSNPSYRDLFNSDLLTGLKNRNAFETDVHNLDSKRHGSVCVFSVDLDGLKAVNDALGHPAGDRYIQAGAGVLQKMLMPGGILYRTGGDEFSIVAPEWDISELLEWSWQLKATLQQQNQEAEAELSLSVGCAEFDPQLDTGLMNTFHRADMLMYEQKRQKKAAVVAQKQS